MQYVFRVRRYSLCLLIDTVLFSPAICALQGLQITLTSHSFSVSLLLISEPFLPVGVPCYAKKRQGGQQVDCPVNIIVVAGTRTLHRGSR